MASGIERPYKLFPSSLNFTSHYSFYLSHNTSASVPIGTFPGKPAKAVHGHKTMRIK